MGEEIGHRHHKDEEKLHDAFLVVIRFLSLEKEDERAVCDGGKEEGEDGDESLVLEVREDQGIERPGVERHLRIAVHGLVEIDQQDLLESDEEIASGSKRGGKGDDDIDQRDIEKIAELHLSFQPQNEDDGQDKDGLQLEAEAQSVKNESKMFPPGKQIINEPYDKESIDGIALTPESGVEENRQAENDKGIAHDTFQPGSGQAFHEQIDIDGDAKVEQARYCLDTPKHGVDLDGADLKDFTGNEAEKADEIQEIVVGGRIVSELASQGGSAVLVYVLIPRLQESRIVSSNAWEEENAHCDAQCRDDDEVDKEVVLVEPTEKTAFLSFQDAVAMEAFRQDALRVGGFLFHVSNASIISHFFLSPKKKRKMRPPSEEGLIMDVWTMTFMKSPIGIFLIKCLWETFFPWNMFPESRKNCSPIRPTGPLSRTRSPFAMR